LHLEKEDLLQIAANPLTETEQKPCSAKGFGQWVARWMDANGLTNPDVITLAQSVEPGLALDPSAISKLKNGLMVQPSMKLFLILLSANRACFGIDNDNPRHRVKACCIPLPGSTKETSMEDLSRYFLGIEPIPTNQWAKADTTSADDLKSLNFGIRRGICQLTLDNSKSANISKTLRDLYPVKSTRRKGEFARWLGGEDWPAEKIEIEAYCLAVIAENLTKDPSVMEDPIGYIAQMASFYQPD
jgi:hypothetical protein